MTPLDRFRHILAMAAADGRMNESELGFLSSRAMQLGITDDQFEAVLKEAIEGGPIPFVGRVLPEIEAHHRDVCRAACATDAGEACSSPSSSRTARYACRSQETRSGRHQR